MVFSESNDISSQTPVSQEAKDPGEYLAVRGHRIADASVITAMLWYKTTTYLVKP